MSATDPRIHPVEDNLLYFVDRVRSAGLDWIVDRSELGVPAYSSGVQFPMFNLVAGATPSGSSWEDLADLVTTDFNERGEPWMWWTTPSYGEMQLASTLSARGLIAESAPGMFTELGTELPEPDASIEIVEVSPHDEDFASTLVAGFGLPSFIRDPMKWIMGVFSEDEQFILVAYEEGWPVGVGSGLITGSTLGIYNIAAIPESRGHGVGSAVTSALMTQGRSRGCDHAILHSSPRGWPLYVRLGFAEVCPTTQWVWLPKREGVPAKAS